MNGASEGQEGHQRTKPLYFFHIRQGEDLDLDEEGIDLPSSDAAHDEALLAAREMVAEFIREGEVIDGMTFEITDADGDIIATVPFLSVVN